MNDEQPQSPPPSDTPAPSQPEPGPEPPTDFGNTDVMITDDTPPPSDFGSQVVERGGLPSDLETRIKDIDKRGS